MKNKGRNPKRNPLSDRSNVALLPTFTSSSKFRADSKSSSSLVAPLSSSDASIASSDSHEPNPKCQENPEQNSSSLSENIDKENYKHSKIDGRNRTEEKKNKGKAVASVVPSSCHPVNRNRNFGNRLKNLRNVDLSKKPSVPEYTSRKTQKKRRHSMPEAPVHALPKAFIDEQRAYFAEIDAFELPEEVVSESELE